MIDYNNWSGCTIYGIEELLKDTELVSYLDECITVEDGYKQYCLYYPTTDDNGNKIYIIFGYGDIIQGLNDSFKPISVVEFAKENNLKIDTLSYIAICKLYSEECEFNNGKIPIDRLPTKSDLESVLINGYGESVNLYLNQYDIDTWKKYSSDYINE